MESTEQKSDKEQRYAINLDIFSVVLYGLRASVVLLSIFSASTKESVGTS